MSWRGISGNTFPSHSKRLPVGGRLGHFRYHRICDSSLLDSFVLDLLWSWKERVLSSYTGDSGIGVKKDPSSTLDREAGPRGKEDGRPKEYQDHHEKAILLLLWGKRGWKWYRSLGRPGFSMENLFRFLRTKKDAKKTDDV
jgi:hypothetical protein